MAEKAENNTPHRAGLFDIRIIIGSLIGLYGLILVVAGLFTNESQLAKADDLNINLWAGLGMLAAGIVFGAWAWLRPIVVPPEPVKDEDDKTGAH